MRKDTPTQLAAVLLRLPPQQAYRAAADIQAAAQALRSAHALPVLASRALPLQQRSAALLAALGVLSLHEKAVAAVAYLQQQGQLAQLPRIAGRVLARVSARTRTLPVVVHTPTVLSKDVLNDMAVILARLYPGGHFVISQQPAPQAIAGVDVQVGDTLYALSAGSRLRRLAEQL